jgi:hypothetical protein
VDPDDVEYRKSVRNMSLVLAAIVITAFAGIFVPPYFFSAHNMYVPSVSEPSPFGFTLHLSVNSTMVTRSGTVSIAGWVNSTSATIEDINASSSWGLPQSQLWGSCNAGWPIGIGIMKGHYTEANFSSGNLINLAPLRSWCGPISGPPSSPKDFVLRPHSSQALITANGSPEVWNLVSYLSFSATPPSKDLQLGVYTAVIADEWGDVLTMIFQVT